MFHSGPLTNVPEMAGLFLFTDRNAFNVRVLDLINRRVYTLCQSWRSNTGKRLLSAGKDLVECDLYEPWSVVITEEMTDILVGHADGVTSIPIQCK